MPKCRILGCTTRARCMGVCMYHYDKEYRIKDRVRRNIHNRAYVRSLVKLKNLHKKEFAKIMEAQLR